MKMPAGAKKMKNNTLYGWNIKKPKSKIEKVLAHLVEHGNIDTWKAITNYGATRLSSIIFNLRVHFKIINKVIRDKQDGRKHYVSYILKGKKR
tara:strand:- start:5153 stop:5431 length:279 start_codon:yes stop_codon:yes gene_type:complete